MNFVPVFETMASLIFTGYLVWAAWQDVREMQVVRYTHILGIFAVILQGILQKERVLEGAAMYLAACLILLFLQTAAKRLALYGMADIIVFFLSGLFFLVSKGVEQYLLAYFLVQALSGIMLLTVQAWKHNVKGLNLGHPVPYIPYICVAFILTNMVL